MFKPKLPSTLSVLYALAILAAMWECFTIVNREPGDTFSATPAQIRQGAALHRVHAGYDDGPFVVAAH